MITLRIVLNTSVRVFVDSLTFHDWKNNSTVVIDTKSDNYFVPVPGIFDEISCIDRYSLTSKEKTSIDILVPIINGRIDYNEDETILAMERYELKSADIYTIKKDSLNRARKKKYDISLIDCVKVRNEKTHSWLPLYEHHSRRVIGISGLNATVTINSPDISSFESAVLYPMSGKRNIMVEIVGSPSEYKKEHRNLLIGFYGVDTQKYMDDSSYSIETANGKTIIHYNNVAIRILPPLSRTIKQYNEADFMWYCFHERKNLSCYYIHSAEVYYMNNGIEMEVPKSEDYFESIVFTFKRQKRTVSGRDMVFRP
jgi:hypothetical protein